MQKGQKMKKQQTALQTAQERIKELQTKKAADLAEISEKQKEARTQIEAADLAMKEATEALNVEEYEKARANKLKWQTALDMYTERYKQIQQQELISEADSDSIVNDLLFYEEDLAENFRRALFPKLQELKTILWDYRDEVEKIENTLHTWETEIHANYTTRGASSFIDPDTGIRTDRSAVPVPIHRVAYNGCKEAEILATYLHTAL